MRHFIEHEGIELIHYRMEGNKEPFIEISHDDISHALVKLLDERSHPGMFIFVEPDICCELILTQKFYSAHTLFKGQGNEARYFVSLTEI